MKKLLIVILFICLLSSVSFGQQTILAKFIVEDARKNGQDITPAYTSQNAYFIFYTLPNDTTLHFSGVMPIAKTESFGIAYNMQTFITPKTSTEYETDHFTFDWSYANSYDTHKGTARIKLLKIGKPNGVAFELTMITESLDVFEYKGYMEGTLYLH